MKSARSATVWAVLMLVAALCWTSAVQADRPDWQRREVNWRIAGGSSIKAIDYPLMEKLLRSLLIGIIIGRQYHGKRLFSPNLSLGVEHLPI